MSEQVARFNPGENVPGFAKAQVNAGRFVAVVATKNASGAYPIEHAAAKSPKPLGVAQQDSGPASEDEHSEQRMVNVIRRGAVARVQAGENLTATDEVGVGANGKAVKAELPSEAEVKEGKTTKVPAVGRCLTTVSAEAYAEVDLY